MKTSPVLDLIYSFLSLSLSLSRMEEEQEDTSTHGMEDESNYNA